MIPTTSRSLDSALSWITRRIGETGCDFLNWTGDRPEACDEPATTFFRVLLPSQTVVFGVHDHPSRKIEQSSSEAWFCHTCIAALIARPTV